MTNHSTLSPNAMLQLHLVPAGRRLDFDMMPGQFAHVYRRLHLPGWECVARNAHSPYVDNMPLPLGSQAEYVVLYYDTAGHVTAASPIRQASPSQMPAAPRRVGFR